MIRQIAGWTCFVLALVALREAIIASTWHPKKEVSLDEIRKAGY